MHTAIHRQACTPETCRNSKAVPTREELCATGWSEPSITIIWFTPSLANSVVDGEGHCGCILNNTNIDSIPKNGDLEAVSIENEIAVLDPPPDAAAGLWSMSGYILFFKHQKRINGGCTLEKKCSFQASRRLWAFWIPMFYVELTRE